MVSLCRDIIHSLLLLLIFGWSVFMIISLEMKWLRRIFLFLFSSIKDYEYLEKLPIITISVFQWVEKRRCIDYNRMLIVLIPCVSIHYRALVLLTENCSYGNETIFNYEIHNQELSFIQTNRRWWILRWFNHILIS